MQGSHQERGIFDSWFPRALTLACLLALLGPVQGSMAETQADPPPNVILIIGDGMDDQQITIARNYLVGSNGKLTLDGLPVRSTAQVLTVDESDP